MKKQIFFTLALVLFSKNNNAVTMDTIQKLDNSVETKKVTLIFTEQDCTTEAKKDKNHWTVINHKLREELLSDQEIGTADVVNGPYQMNQQLGTNLQNIPDEIRTKYCETRNLLLLLEFKEPLSLEITYNPERGKYIKGD